MTATDPTLKALWRAVEAAPDCRLTRGVYADALEEAGEYDLAEACRATADKWPEPMVYGGSVYWFDGGETGCPNQYWVPDSLFRHLKRGTRTTDLFYRDYKTARAALLDLWRAWVRVNKGGEGA